MAKKLDDRTFRLGAALRELISALDSRRPRIERIGEAGIASDAAGPRITAVKRLEELSHPGANRRPYDEEREGSIMTDDGSPSAAKSAS
jgi:hypothetical protein